MRALWPRWTLLPAAPFVLWPVYCFSRGEYGRWELWLLALFGLVVPYWNARTKKLYVGIGPLALVGPLYDAMRFIQNLGITPERVHVCDLRAIDVRFFGITYQGQPATLHDWLQAHAQLGLDVFFSIPYGTFLEVEILIGIFLYLRDYPAMRRFTLSFFLLNVFGFITYHVYPAAPPWWYHAHGCGLVDLVNAAPSEGPNLARVDAFFGIHYFGGFYGRSHDIFGAVPSLHVAYPLLIFLCGWRSFKPWMRVASGLFFVWMCCAAVYLDHHWVFDVVLGITYTLIVVGTLTWLERRSAPAPVAA
jgi:hypothetical protein